MNAILNFCCVLSVVCLFSLIAGNVRDEQGTVTEVKSQMAESRREPVQPTLFNSHARAKAVQYFDTFRAEPYGLPPACFAMMNPMENPALIANIGINVGQMVKENERVGLLDAPSELVRVFPAQPQGVRYCLAGNHLVVVDGNCRVLDSVRIPTIHLSSVYEFSSSVKLAGNPF